MSHLNTMSSPYLFVYGTLMRGLDNPFSKQLSELSDFQGEGYFHGKLYQVSWYPGAVYLPLSTDRVYGEVYHLKDEARLLHLLDEYEDVHPDPAQSLYKREILPVSTLEGKILICWAYLYNRSAEGLQEIENGKFPKT